MPDKPPKKPPNGLTDGEPQENPETSGTDEKPNTSNEDNA